MSYKIGKSQSDVHVSKKSSWLKPLPGLWEVPPAVKFGAHLPRIWESIPRVYRQLAQFLTVRKSCLRINMARIPYFHARGSVLSPNSEHFKKALGINDPSYYCNQNVHSSPDNYLKSSTWSILTVMCILLETHN